MTRAGTIYWMIGLSAVVLAGAAPVYAQQCDDGQDCTANDMCSDGVCIGTPQSSGSCDDFDECTVNDRCQPDSSCRGEPAPLGTACMGGCGTCQQLIPDTPLMCRGNPSDNGKPCDAGNACLESQCVIAGNTPVCLSLQLKECPDTDGNPCTDVCNFETGQCERDVPKCFPTCETCNTSTGACEPANAGAACDDFDPCSAQSRCEVVDIGEGVQRGLCRAGAPTVTIPTPTATSPEVTPTTPPGGACVGDCNGNHIVVVNELVQGVNIALGSAPVSQCTAFDVDGSNMVEVNELIGGVNALLNGCPS